MKVPEVPDVRDLPDIRSERECRIKGGLVIQVDRPALLVGLPVSRDTADRLIDTGRIIQEVSVKGPKVILVGKVPQFNPFLEPTHGHISLIKGCIHAIRDSPEKG